MDSFEEVNGASAALHANLVVRRLPINFMLHFETRARLDIWRAQLSGMQDGARVSTKEIFPMSFQRCTNRL